MLLFLSKSLGTLLQVPSLFDTTTLQNFSIWHQILLTFLSEDPRSKEISVDLCKKVMQTLLASAYSRKLGKLLENAQPNHIIACNIILPILPEVIERD